MSILNNIKDDFEAEVIGSYILLKVIEYVKGGREGREVLQNVYLGRKSNYPALWTDIFPSEMIEDNGYGEQVTVIWKMKNQLVKNGQLIQYGYRGKKGSKKKVVAKIIEDDFKTIEILRQKENNPNSRALTTYIDINPNYKDSGEPFDIIGSFKNEEVIAIIKKHINKTQQTAINKRIEECYQLELKGEKEHTSTYKSGDSLFL